MTLNGYLSEFSLGEIFQLIEKGNKTGLLSIRNLFSDKNRTASKYYLWFKQGRIIAAANRLDQKGLQTLIQKRGWLRDSVSNKLSQFCEINTPLGLCLKSQGALTHDQLKLLFITQVMQQVCTVFKLDQGFFQFDPHTQPSVAEMTGLSKPATELTLVGLRMLKNWTPLQEKLPESSSGLISLLEKQPHYSLNAQEWQVWEYTKGTIALQTIARELQIPLEKVQQIAFRLIVIGVAEELPMAEMIPPQLENEPPKVENQSTPSVSSSFLNHLTSFLQTKTA
ncbi:MAG: DUF4388 domain-containing protein [Halothece sp.]